MPTMTSTLDANMRGVNEQLMQVLMELHGGMVCVRCVCVLIGFSNVVVVSVRVRPGGSEIGAVQARSGG
jgi:hypothetical protein